MTETKKRLTPLERSKQKPKSAILAIAAFCYRCTGGENSDQPSVAKANVRDCPSTDCPLWHKRPWRGVTTRSS